MRDAGGAGGSGEFVFSEDVVRHLFRPLSSASISALLVHDGAGNIGLLDARLTSIGVRHGALRAWVYSLVGVPRDDAVGQRLGVGHRVVPVVRVYLE